MVMGDTVGNETQTAEKSFEKGLTKIRKCAIINKLSERQSGTLKIEQCNQRGTLEDSVFTEETR